MLHNYELIVDIIDIVDILLHIGRNGLQVKTNILVVLPRPAPRLAHKPLKRVPLDHVAKLTSLVNTTAST